MTDRAELPQRLPRLVAGLWFGTFFVLAQLTLRVAFSLIVSPGFRGYLRPPVPTLAEGYLLLTSACAGAWLGSALLTRKVSAAEGARRGAWIGILSGTVAALPGTLLAMVHAVASSDRQFRWPTAAWVVVLVLFQGGRLLPVGALAGWCLVRASRLKRRSKRERTAT